MSFSIMEWRRMYNKMHMLGKLLSEGRPSYDEFYNYIAPIAALSKSAQLGIEAEMKALSEQSNRYLDRSGIRGPQPLWKYSRKDKTSHASHVSFQYGHLIKG